MTSRNASGAGRDGAAQAMRRINAAWLDGRVDDLAALSHADVVTVAPDFAARAQGRDEFLAGFRDFCQNATIHEFHEQDEQVDVVGDTAVVTYRYAMVYERSGKRYHATGRDFWILQWDAGAWRAVWRTMLDLEEHIA